MTGADPHGADATSAEFHPERPLPHFAPDSLEDELMRTPFAGGFPAWRVAPDERVLVDVHPRRTILIPPLVKLLVASLLAGLAVGLTGAVFPYGPFTSPAFNQTSTPPLTTVVLIAVVVVWLVLAVRWWVLPLVRWRRNRLAITNYRVVHALNPKDIAELPLRQVYSVDRQGSTITFAVNGHAPLVVNSVPKARRVTRVIQRRIR